MKETARVEALLAEIGRGPVPVEDEAAAELRRERTIDRLRGLQARTLAEQAVAGKWRRRLVVAALAALVPAVGLAAASGFSFHAGASPDAGGARPAVMREGSGPVLPRGASDPEAARPDPRAPEPLPLAAPLPEGAASGPAARRPDPTTGMVGSGRPVAAPARGRSRATLAPPDPPGSTLAAENALLQRGLAAARVGEDRAALVAFDRLLALHPGSPLAGSARVERFRALSRLGEADAAAREARRYLADQPDEVGADQARRIAVGSPRGRGASEGR